MRADRLKNLYPKLKPKLLAIAFKLLNGTIKDIEPDDLLQEGLIAIKRTKTTVKRPHKLSYLLERAKLRMIRYIKIQKDYSLSSNFIIIPIDAIRKYL